jgi:predicted transcriptional regulator with HTH domain
VSFSGLFSGDCRSSLVCLFEGVSLWISFIRSWVSDLSLFVGYLDPSNVKIGLQFVSIRWSPWWWLVLVSFVILVDWSGLRLQYFRHNIS